GTAVRPAGMLVELRVAITAGDLQAARGDIARLLLLHYHPETGIWEDTAAQPDGSFLVATVTNLSVFVLGVGPAPIHPPATPTAPPAMPTVVSITTPGSGGGILTQLNASTATRATHDLVVRNSGNQSFRYVLTVSAPTSSRLDDPVRFGYPAAEGLQLAIRRC